MLREYHDDTTGMLGGYFSHDLADFIDATLARRIHH